MQQIRMVAVAIVCTALLWAGATTAAAQAPLDDTWFQVDATIKGELVDPADGSVTAVRLKRTAYFYVYDDGGQYTIALLSETAPGTWSQTGSGTVPPPFITDEGLYTVIQVWQIATPAPTMVVFYLHGKFTLKLNTDGSLKKAKFSVLGATLVPAQYNMDGDYLFGKAKIKAKMIDAGDLPPGIPLI